MVEPKVIRRFKQTRPVADTQGKPTLSKDILARVSLLKLNIQLIQFCLAHLLHDAFLHAGILWFVVIVMVMETIWETYSAALGYVWL